MNILITGGAGFIGSTLVDKLLEQNLGKIVVVDSFTDFYGSSIKKENINVNYNNPDYKIYTADIENKENLRSVFAENSIDCVIHLAARAGVRPSIDNPELYFKTNVLGTLNVLELMKEFNIKRLIFASSSSVYGNSKADLFSEDLNLREPISPYAASKLSCEQLCYTYSKLYDIKTVCFRFFTVYGPRQRPDLAISKFVDLITQGKSIPVYGDGTTMRDYTFIDDIVSGVISAINYNGTDYEIINLAGGRAVMLNELIQVVETCLGKKAIIERLPMQSGDVDKTIADISKARRLLGYSPKVSFKEGVGRFIEWKFNLEALKNKMVS
ncbi:MAG: GDP-mannose 4,6-dehydratase [Lactobacillaceae bacterium]|jgi:UDP-glucuronate 4-epimerase|nr:GDP-mannose 4,6-dehydratase [Lactobacillaceae bacterium]